MFEMIDKKVRGVFLRNEKWGKNLHYSMFMWKLWNINIIDEYVDATVCACDCDT